MSTRKKILFDLEDMHHINEYQAHRHAQDASSTSTWGFLTVISFFGIGGFGMWIDSQNVMIGGIIATVFCVVMQKISTTHID